MLAIERGWLWKHRSGTYVKFTQTGTELCLVKCLPTRARTHQNLHSIGAAVKITEHSRRVGRPTACGDLRGGSAVHVVVIALLARSHLRRRTPGTVVGPLSHGAPDLVRLRSDM
jgi:hypothetical protein